MGRDGVDVGGPWSCKEVEVGTREKKVPMAHVKMCPRANAMGGGKGTLVVRNRPCDGCARKWEACEAARTNGRRSSTTLRAIQNVSFACKMARPSCISKQTLQSNGNNGVVMRKTQTRKRTHAFPARGIHRWTCSKTPPPTPDYSSHVTKDQSAEMHLVPIEYPREMTRQRLNGSSSIGQLIGSRYDDCVPAIQRLSIEQFVVKFQKNGMSRSSMLVQ